MNSDWSLTIVIGRASLFRLTCGISRRTDWMLVLDPSSRSSSQARDENMKLPHVH